jgi:geranylgeranyl diphosphate synthase type II
LPARVQITGGSADRRTSGTLGTLEAIHARKTAALFTASVEVGGLCGGADDEQLAALRCYGLRLGLAFQITDDLLDFAGHEAALGKRVNKDSQHGKLTYPGLLGAVESQRRAESLIEEAIAALSPSIPHADGLEAVARFVLERDR